MKYSKQGLFYCLLVVSILGGWLCIARAEINRVRPSSPTVRFEQFELEMEPPVSVGFFTYENNRYLEWKGPRMHGIVLPSGYPSYVFNEMGILVDWTSDDGDNPTYLNRWGNFQEWKPATLQDFKDYLSQQPGSAIDN